MIIFNQERGNLKHKYTLLANSAYFATDKNGIKNKKLKGFLQQNENEKVKRLNNEGKEKEITVAECIKKDIKELRNYFSHYHHNTVQISKEAQEKIYNKLYSNACAGMFGVSLASSPPPLFDDKGCVTREGAIFIFSLTADKSLVNETISRNYEKEIDEETKKKTKKTDEEEFFSKVIEKYTMKDSHSILDNEDENTQKALVIKSFLCNLKKDLEKTRKKLEENKKEEPSKEKRITKSFVSQNIFFDNVYNYVVDKKLLPDEYKFFTIEDKKMMHNLKNEKNINRHLIITEEDKNKIYYKNNNVFAVKKTDIENKNRQLKYITISRTMLNRLIRAHFNGDTQFTFKKYIQLSNKKTTKAKKEVNIKARLEYILKKQKEYICEEKTTKNQKIDIILKYINDNLPQNGKLGKEEYHQLFNTLIPNKYISQDFITMIDQLTNNGLDAEAKQVVREKKDDFMGLFKKIVNKNKKDLERQIKRLKEGKALKAEEKSYIGIKSGEKTGDRQFISVSLKQMLEKNKKMNELFNIKMDDAELNEIIEPLKEKKDKENYTDAIILFKIGNYYLNKIYGIKEKNILDFAITKTVTTGDGTEYTIKIENPLSYKHITSFDDLQRLVKVQLEQPNHSYTAIKETVEDGTKTKEINIINDQIINDMVTNHRIKSREFMEAVFYVENNLLYKKEMEKQGDSAIPIEIHADGYSEILSEMDTKTPLGRFKILRNSCFHNHILYGQKDNKAPIHELEGYQQAENIFAEIAQEHKTKNQLQHIREYKLKKFKK